jgi:hypothetical protein
MRPADIATAPLPPSRQRMSLLPSPLKSPVATSLPYSKPEYVRGAAKVPSPLPSSRTTAVKMLELIGLVA